MFVRYQDRNKVSFVLIFLSCTVWVEHSSTICQIKSISVSFWIFNFCYTTFISVRFHRAICGTWEFESAENNIFFSKKFAFLYKQKIGYLMFCRHFKDVENLLTRFILNDRLLETFFSDSSENCVWMLIFFCLASMETNFQGNRKLWKNLVLVFKIFWIANF